MLLRNGRIHTMGRAGETADALYIENDTIRAVGSWDEVRQVAPVNEETVDLEGCSVLPGFNDSHMHLLMYGANKSIVDLRGAASLEECIARTRSFIAQNGVHPGKWVQAFGWNNDRWEEARFPTRDDLDRISTDHPVSFKRACGHASVLNGMALDRLGIDGDMVPKQGSYDRDAAGKPNGILREMSYAIRESIPAPSLAEIKEMILAAGRDAAAVGITSVQTDDFGVLSGDPRVNTVQIIRAYRELAERGELPVRIYEQCSLRNVDGLGHFWENGFRSGDGDDYFRFGPLKLFTDGSLGARTALLTEPYSDAPDTRGIAIYRQEELDEIVGMAHEASMAAAIHAIGDEAMWMAIRAIERAKRKAFKPEVRHGIVHCQITNPAIIEKFAELDLVAHIQPIFLDYDLHIVESRVGVERASTSYNWKRLLDSGIHVACGTDAPVEKFDPLPNVCCAVTRRDSNGNPPGGWLPDQRLSVREAIGIYTAGSAFASHDERRKGTIAPGMLADLVVLDEDVFDIEPGRIKDISVRMTLCGGIVTHSK